MTSRCMFKPGAPVWREEGWAQTPLDQGVRDALGLGAPRSHTEGFPEMGAGAGLG